MTGIGENTLAQPVKPPLRERRACLAKLVKNRLTLTVDGDRSTGPPLRAAICSGDSPRRRQSLIASSLAAAAGSSASIPRLDETRTESAHSCAARAS